MARSAATHNRSEAIRDYLKKHNDVGVKAIQVALKGQGIEVSSALISKIKYRRDAAKNKRGRKASSKSAGAAKVKPAHGDKVNKSAEIRSTFRELGKKARPKDVVAALAEKGITVSPAQVSMVRFKMKTRRAAEKAAVATAPTSREPTTGSPEKFSGQDLIEAKKFADQLGGMERLKAALDVLAQLA